MSEREDLGLAAICLVVVLLSLGGLVAAFMPGLFATLDGLLLILISLMMAAIFAPPLIAIAKQMAGKKKPAAEPAEGKK